jgi:hypothetical protein
MPTLEETTKLSKDLRFTILGRAIADAVRTGKNPSALVEEARLIRHQEQNAADKNTRFAALTRQVGDAAWSGQDLNDLLERLRSLRQIEIGD